MIFNLSSSRNTLCLLILLLSILPAQSQEARDAEPDITRVTVTSQKAFQPFFVSDASIDTRVQSGLRASQHVLFDWAPGQTIHQYNYGSSENAAGTSNSAQALVTVWRDGFICLDLFDLPSCKSKTGQSSLPAKLYQGIMLTMMELADLQKSTFLQDKDSNQKCFYLTFYPGKSCESTWLHSDLSEVLPDKAPQSIEEIQKKTATISANKNPIRCLPCNQRHDSVLTAR